MSLNPFTKWLIGEGNGAVIAAKLYASNLAATSMAYGLLWRETCKQHHGDLVLTAHHRDHRRVIGLTIAAYCVAVPFAFVSVYL